MQTDFCRKVIDVEKNASSLGEQMVTQYNLEAPLAVGAFLSDPKYNFSHKQHDVTIRPQSVSYSYSF